MYLNLVVNATRKPLEHLFQDNNYLENEQHTINFFQNHNMKDDLERS